MFSINRTDNTIIPLEEHSLTDLGFGERQHLQEWLAKHPEALGVRPDKSANLLIIQKEFAGFDKTNERLDLLALDRSGHIVVIENKRDDSGKDVTWQALKYAAYSSTLTTDQIVDIYSRYTGQTKDDARESIADFIKNVDAEELSLNPANTQRIMLVATKFRPEVTATAMWLLGKGLNITCFQVTPFSKGDDLFLTVDQIIPPPEAADFMIKLAEKSAMDDTESAALSARHLWRRTYWDQLLERFQEAGNNRLSGNVATTDSYLIIRSDSRNFHYSINALAKEVRIQLNIDSSDGRKNSEAFELLKAKTFMGNAEYGSTLTWYNPPNSKVCRVFDILETDTTNPDNWPEAIEWQRQRLEAMITTFSPYIKEIAAL